jgi:shikimate 5-dehydrogenase
MTTTPLTQQYEIVTKSVPTFYFIGVTTGKSSIMKVFPLWARELGYPEIVMEGIDLKIHDQPENYRAAVAQIKYDPLSLGALVTTHKMDLLEAARDMFEYLDPYAVICGEVSSISKLDGRLEGHAKDPITAGLSMDAILGKDYFSRTGGEVLIFGAGGSSVATLLHLINKTDPGDRPKRFVVVNRSQKRLDTMQAMVKGQLTDIQVVYICNQDPKVNDEIMASMPDHTIVINATGMGKDTPGSPVTDSGLFPMNGIAWDYNYRGELDFLHQAERQVESRGLTVEDGWLYFVHGWAQVVAEVLHIDLTDDLFNRMEALAATVRGK